MQYIKHAKSKIQLTSPGVPWQNNRTELQNALCAGLTQYITNYVFDRMEVGYALALFQLSAIVSVFLGYKVFNEQGLRQKLTGPVIMIAGSVVIIFLN